MRDRELITKRELAAVTEQRDRLVEALERIADYQGRFAEEDPASIATEALQSLIPNDERTHGAPMESQEKATEPLTHRFRDAACCASSFVLRGHVDESGKPDAVELPLAEVMLQVKGHYGFDRFQDAINQPE